MAYNGWTNRETWLVIKWFNPKSRGDVEYAWSIIGDQYKDMIDWDKLMEYYQEDQDQE